GGGGRGCWRRRGRDGGHSRRARRRRLRGRSRGGDLGCGAGRRSGGAARRDQRRPTGGYGQLPQKAATCHGTHVDGWYGSYPGMGTSTTLRISRELAIGSRHMVAAKHPWAVEAALGVLDRGGNAVDAAVTAAFAVSVLEPWMSGIGG